MLYSSPHVKEVFFFSKGDDQTGEHSQTFYCSVLQLESETESRDMKDNCQNFVVASTSLLGEYIDQLDST